MENQAQPLAPLRTNTLLIIGTVVVLIALIAVGLGIALRGGHQASSPPATAASILARATAAHLQDATFTIKNVDAETLGGTAITTTTTGQGTLSHNPQRQHFVLNLVGDPSLQLTPSEIIVNGTTVYIKLPPSERPTNNSKIVWFQFDSSSGGSAQSQLYTTINTSDVTEYAQLSSVKLIGQETLNGQKTWHLQGNVPSGDTSSGAGGITTSSTETEDLWFLQSTYLPLQITLHQTQDLSTGGSGSTSTGSLNSVTDLTTTFTAWNTGATITLPAADTVTTTFPTPTP